MRIVLPANRRPTHPGEMLLEEYLKPLAVTQSAFAEHIGVTFARLNEIINGRRGVTPDTAIRFASALGTTADFWLNLQLGWDLYHAIHSEQGKAAARVKPLELLQRHHREGQTKHRRAV
jgi:addiction module HigA family antidote